MGQQIPFQERGGALRKLASGFIFRIDDRGDGVFRQVVGNGFLEVRRKVAESEVVALQKAITVIKLAVMTLAI